MIASWPGILQLFSPLVKSSLQWMKIFLVLLVGFSLFANTGSRSVAEERDPTVWVHFPGFVKQGQALRVKITAREELSKVTVHLANRVGKGYPLTPTDLRKFIAWLGIPADDQPGNNLLKVTIEKRSGKTEVRQYPLRILAAQFPRDVIQVAPTQTTLLDEKVIANDQTKFAQVLTRESETRQWRGRFQLPVQGTFPSLYGTHRVFNGVPFGYHRGLDIAGGVGVPVYAANHGTVVLAEKLTVHGNTLVIDHGQGVFTLYCHLSRLAKQVSEVVKKGERIGSVGATGLVTGPHLHFGLSIHDARIDPLPWTRMAMDAD